jgi:O-acetylserine/cysteine efflux transporter
MSTSPRLPLSHVLLGLSVVAIWGSNFVVIKLALAQWPPLLFAALRFVLAFAPAALLLPRPAVAWRLQAAYATLLGVGQFGVLYLAMRGAISPGLASLVIQTQVFFTIALAIRFDGQAGLRPPQWLALGLAASGIVLIGAHGGGDATPVGVAMILFAALCWAAANIVATRVRGTPMLPFVVWSSIWTVPPLLALSLAVEGWPAMRAAVLQADLGGWIALAWQAWGNTVFGYGVWAWLLARHPAATISPLALGVPVVGMLSSALWLGESLPGWKLAAAALVIGGLGLNLWVARRR